MPSLLVKLFEHHHWANLMLFDACATLTEDQLDATVHGTAGTVRQTLMHTVGAEQRYVGRLTDRLPTYHERDGWPGLDVLRQALDETGRALIELAGRADPDEIIITDYQGRTDDPLPVAVLYVQAINHATEHRSQIATIMTQQGLAAPDFSGWAWWRAPSV
jgi:uncharacterized damage-inducible protein DinB